MNRQPDFSNATIRPTHPDDLDICPGGINCEEPDQCQDCNINLTGFLTGGSIVATARVGLDYLANGEYQRADNAQRLLASLAGTCERMTTEEALRDVIRGVIHMLQINHNSAARRQTPDTDPSTDSENAAFAVSSEQTSGDPSTPDPWPVPATPARGDHLRLVHSHRPTY